MSFNQFRVCNLFFLWIDQRSGVELQYSSVTIVFYLQATLDGAQRFEMFVNNQMANSPIETLPFAHSEFAI